MTKDYATYCANCSDMPKLAYIVHEQYMPMIKKYAAKTYQCSRCKYDKEDFVADVYLELVKMVQYINPEKVVTNFSFYVFVKNAISHTIQRTKKYSVQNHIKTSSIEEDTFVETGRKDYTIESFVENESMKKFFSTLTPRQITILNYRKKGYTIVQIKDKIDVSHGTVVRDIQLAQKSYSSYMM